MGNLFQNFIQNSANNVHNVGVQLGAEHKYCMYWNDDNGTEQSVCWDLDDQGVCDSYCGDPDNPASGGQGQVYNGLLTRITVDGKKPCTVVSCWCCQSAVVGSATNPIANPNISIANNNSVANPNNSKANTNNIANGVLLTFL